MESIDDILSQLKSEYEDKDNPKPQPKKPPLTKEELYQPPIAVTPPSQNSWQSNVVPSAAEYSLLDELKAEFAEQDREEEIKKQQKLKEEEQIQERIRQQQCQAIKKEAEAWLKKLNPRSAEGLWFEEFAYSYSSKLEAAIDYLQAIKEAKS